MQLKISRVKVLIVGSGAAGLNAALQLSYRGITDILILSEGLEKGTSINTGSDKQTYYKLSLCGEQMDSPVLMAESYCLAGAMHGDLALVESALSAQAFYHLVSLGVPFPHDEYGQFFGYKTDHDPRQRATSIGPYTSKMMVECLARAVRERNIPFREGCEVVELLTVPDEAKKRAVGVIFLNEINEFEVIFAGDIIFAVGGPAGIYKDSVYPRAQWGAIGVALLAGAKARNLSESQFGLASIQFRWNVSGTYMQVLPRVVSTEQDGESGEIEFLLDHFASPNEVYNLLFLKGYQWPFDAAKTVNGSSLLDVLVYYETKIRGRRVFLDYRKNPKGLDFFALSPEAATYLEKSGALFGNPINRLMHMNPGAVELYRQNGIDLTNDMLEIAVCAQHNNGGLAADIWWQSENINHLFPIGEVNGSHGVNRPGGSALNAGQVGGIRAAEWISHAMTSYDENIDFEHGLEFARNKVEEIQSWLEQGKTSLRQWNEAVDEIQMRMSKAGSFFRTIKNLDEACSRAVQLWNQINEEGVKITNPSDRRGVLRSRHLCFTHLIYLDAIRHVISSGVGSRGSSLVMGEGADQTLIHPSLPSGWKMESENPAFRSFVLDTVVDDLGRIQHEWVACREIPHREHWFETDWARFLSGGIYIL